MGLVVPEREQRIVVVVVVVAGVPEELMKIVVHVRVEGSPNLQSGRVISHLLHWYLEIEMLRLGMAWLLCSCLHFSPDHPSSA